MWVKIGDTRICVEGLTRYCYEKIEDEKVGADYFLVNLDFKNVYEEIEVSNLKEIQKVMKELDSIFFCKENKFDWSAV